MQISKILLVISLGVNAMLVLSTGSLKNRYEENANKSIKIAEKISYNVGCMQALAASMHVSTDDVLEPMYQEWCTKNAVSFSHENVISVK